MYALECVFLAAADDGGDPMADVMASIRSGQVKLKKTNVEEKPVDSKCNSYQHDSNGYIYR